MLYQINTRVLLRELSDSLGRSATLDDIPNQLLNSWKDMGFEWIWLLSVWQTGLAAQSVSRSHSGWREEFRHTLSDLQEDDIEGSGFAIQSYRVHDKLGGDAGLARFRSRLAQRGLKLMLDFVPNHMAPDHPWIEMHPEFFVEGTEDLLRSQPKNYFRHASGKIFAYGRDPYFDGWPDTIQLDYSQPDLQSQMREELIRIADQCDGLRCDMAMLILPDVFLKTWGRVMPPFWHETIDLIKHRYPSFCFMAEVYWDREWELQQQGFDYCYDKRLYDRLLHEDAASIRGHLSAGLDYQSKLARFLENHDEKRIASCLEEEQHFAAAALTYLTPGLRFFHEGQFEGRKTRLSPHLARRPNESPNTRIQEFYDQLRKIATHPVITNGKWLTLEARPAWDGNPSYNNLICFRWKDSDNRVVVIAVNYSDQRSQCRLRFAIDRTCVSQTLLRDLATGTIYERHRGELFNPGLFVDLGPWQFHAFEEIDG